MRILASNPDTLGDLVLRQPMCRALSEAGHELALIVRPAVAPLVRYVAPGARVLELPYEVYANDLEQQWGRFEDLFAQARDFRPDLLLVAPYRWTLFEEKLAQELPGVRSAGMSGHLYTGDPYHGHAPESRLRFDLTVPVEEDAPEFAKNADLASAVLGFAESTVRREAPRDTPGSEPQATTRITPPANEGGPIPRASLPPPTLEVDDAVRRRAGEILTELGLDPGGYWLACVTGTAHVTLKAWPVERWADVLRRWAAERGRRFLFVGLNDEEPTVRAVQERMGNAASQTRRWMPPGGTIDELIGLTALSAGYVGHDTGPMHLAAALGRPVLAVFGGGHRLRFQPAVEPSVTVTVGVACAGCEWSCSFATSHCVKDVSVDEVWQGALDLEAGRVTGREARVLRPSHELQTRMVREAAEFAQAQLRERAEAGRKLAASYESWERDVADLRQQVQAKGREADALSGQMAARAGEVEQIRAVLDAKHQEFEAVGARLAEQDDRLREKEVTIGEQDRLLREQAAKLLEQDAARREQEIVLREREALLKEQDDALAARSVEIDRLSGEVAQLRSALDARSEELGRARGELQLKAQEAGALSARLALHTGEIDRVRQEINGMIEQADQAKSNGNGQAPAPPASELLLLSRELIGRQDKELAELREQVKALEARLRAIEPKVTTPRRTWRQLATDLVIGTRHYTPRRRPRPLPSVTVVTPVHNAAATVRDTIESVLGQTYAHLEYVVVDGGSTDGTLDILNEYKDRIDQLITGPDAGPFDALAKGFDAATGEVFVPLYAGDLLEPGGVFRIAERFARTRAKAVYFDDALRFDDGWRFPAPPRPTPTVYDLLHDPDLTRLGVYFTANAYRALAGFNKDLAHAADYDWWLRLVRRFGVERGAGQVRSVRVRASDPEREQSRREERVRVREKFLTTFGWPGRVRGRLLQVASRLTDARPGWEANGRRLALPLFPPLPPAEGRGEGEWSSAPDSRNTGGSGPFDARPHPNPLPGGEGTIKGAARKPLPPGEPLPFVPGQPVSPVSDRFPDRILFSTRDTLTGDRAVHTVYYDSDGGAALAYPPVSAERLRTLYDRLHAGDDAGPKQPVPPDPAYASPYANYVGSRLGALLTRLPSPYWWFRRPEFGDTTVDTLLSLLSRHVNLRGQERRLLNVGCFRGDLLDRLKHRTDWTLFGTETNPAAADAARAKGYTVWDVSAQDAAQAIPIGQQFDVILLGHTLEHLQNPTMVLRRLRQLLVPGGLVAFNAPNLDSKHAELYGPTWAGWQVPYHRTLLGRRGVRRMASLAGMEVVALRTITHPYPATASAQLNAFGLGGVVPEGAKFPDEVSSRGVRLTGWSRLLWDWRGRGDFLYAVLKVL